MPGCSDLANNASVTQVASDTLTIAGGVFIQDIKIR